MAIPALASADGQVRFCTDADLTTPWPTNRTDTGTAAGNPVVEWGDTIWIRFQHPQFDATAGTIVAYFRRVDPPGTAPYGFQVNVSVPGANPSVGRVGLDVGFFCPTGARPDDPAKWLLGVPQRAKRVAAGPPKAIAEDNRAGAGSITPAFDATAPVYVHPGAWEVWAQQTVGISTHEITPHAFLRVGNPLALLCPRPAAFGANALVPPWSVADPACSYFWPGLQASLRNGNPDFAGSVLPGRRVLWGSGPASAWSFAQVGHGSTSVRYTARPDAACSFAVCDRSRLNAVSLPVDPGGGSEPMPHTVRLKVRVANGSLNPANPSVYTDRAAFPQPMNMDWAYDLQEYPPIPAEMLFFAPTGDVGGDLRTEGIPLPTRYPLGDPNADQVAPLLFDVSVRVPRYQPDCTYGTGLEAIAEDAARLPSGLPAAHPIRVWCDLDGDDTLARIDAGAGGVVCDLEAVWYPDRGRYEPPAAYEERRPYAEPYCEFNLTVNVPPDFRFRVAEPVVDVGKQAHNAAGPAGIPHSWGVRPLTLLNEGNVNLVSLRVWPDLAEMLAFPAGDPRRGALRSGEVECDLNFAATNPTRGCGLFIPWTDPVPPAAGPARTHVWWSLADPTTDSPSSWAGTDAAFAPRMGALRKPRPDDPSPSTLEGIWSTADGATGYVGPRVGLITPFGQPVGTYSARVRLYEDRDRDGTLDYDPAAPLAGDRPAVEGFAVKVTVTDRQLTEDPNATGLDRPVLGIRTGGVVSRAGSFLRWLFPDSLTSPTRYLKQPRPSSDSLPAAVRFRDPRDRGHRRLAFYWSSNRPDRIARVDGALRQPQPPGTVADMPACPGWAMVDPADPRDPSASWYLYGSRTWETKDAAGYTWPFWALRPPGYDTGNAAATAAPPELKLPPHGRGSLFALSPAPGLALASEAYVAPAIAVTHCPDPGDAGRQAPAYLFFQGKGNHRGAGRSVTASGLYYTALDAAMQPDPTHAEPGPDAGLPWPKPVVLGMGDFTAHGVRGLSYRPADGSDAHYLWAFWHGGAAGALHPCFSFKVRRGGGDYTPWMGGPDTHRHARLPVYGDFTTVQDLAPVLASGPYTDPRTGASRLCDLIEVYFTGFSKCRGRAGIYRARLDPARLIGGRHSSLDAKLPFAPVRLEVLANVQNRAFVSRHLEWVMQPATSSSGHVVFPRIFRRPAGSSAVQALTTDPSASGTAGWSFDVSAPSWTFRYTGYTSASNPGLSGENSLTVYPLAGVVVFSKPLADGDQVLADYTPLVLSVTSSKQPDMSPCAFVDTRRGPAVGGSFQRVYTRRDRLWVFWTRVSPQAGLPTVWHKTMRLGVQLPSPISPSQSVTVTDEMGRQITGFTLDAPLGRVYFPTSQSGGAAGSFALEGRRVAVSYTPSGGSGGQPLDPYIRWLDEMPETPLPIDTAANEGGVCAVPDLEPTDGAGDPLDLSSPANVQRFLNDPGTWRVWLFWSSSRPKATTVDAATAEPVLVTGDTDIHYMTIAPRLDNRLPTGP